MGRKSNQKVQNRLEAFARHFVILNSNGTQAAIAAGYSRKTAAFQASALLKNHKVKTLIASFLGRQNKKLDISVERTLSQIAKHAFLDPRVLFNEDGSLKRISELDEETAACISAIEMAGKRIKRIKLTDPLRALEQLARYHKLFSEDRTPMDLGVKYVVLDMPRPLRPAGGAAQLPGPNGTNAD